MNSATNSSFKPDPVFIESLLHCTWYTADRQKPYLVKAGANIEYGYAILITDMDHTYFCAGDPHTILTEKKVCFNTIFFI